MKNNLNWDPKTLINELTQGKELVEQLRVHLDPSSSSSSSTGEFLIAKLQSSLDKSLLMLNGVKSEVEPQLTELAVVLPTESPRSLSGSPRSDYDCDLNGDMSKKRKTLPRWTKQIRVCPETGHEGPLEDGYSWRKYGQKDILGAKHPRGYYRCTHRNVQGCLAVKQVQRSDEDFSIFNVTYRGRHTCSQASRMIPAQSPKKQNEAPKQKKSKQTFINFQTTGLEVKTEHLDAQEFRSSSFSFPSTSPMDCLEKENNIFSSLTPDNHFMGTFSSPFISPTTSESNYLSPYRMNSFGQNLQTAESELNEIISAATSASHSPMLDLDLDFPVDFDSEFPFDNLGFYN